MTDPTKKYWWYPVPENAINQPQAAQAQAEVRQPEPNASQEKPRPEPVARITPDGRPVMTRRPGLPPLPVGTLLYAGAEPGEAKASVARQPLTENDIADLWVQESKRSFDEKMRMPAVLWIVRAIERAHGITATPAPREGR